MFSFFRKRPDPTHDVLPGAAALSDPQLIQAVLSVFEKQSPVTFDARSGPATWTSRLPSWAISRRRSASGRPSTARLPSSGRMTLRPRFPGICMALFPRWLCRWPGTPSKIPRSAHERYVYLTACASVSEASAQLGRFIEFHNTPRPRSSLGRWDPRRVLLRIDAGDSTGSLTDRVSPIG